jgi:SnoaL-like domain
MDTADRLALLELHARYAQTMDGGSAQAWAACFTPQGKLRTSRQLHLQGHRALAKFAAEWHSANRDQRRHMTWHHRFEGDAQTAEGTCYAALLRTGETGVRMEYTAVYRDRFARLPEGWAIEERSVAIDHIGG